VSPAALGCRAHSGWAAVVVVAGAPASPEVLLRRRIEIADAAIRGSKQPYHAAESLPLPQAQAAIERCAASTQRMARSALLSIVEEMKKTNHQIVALGVLLGSGKPLPPLASVLKSHPLLHTAEGEFFRNAIAAAGEHCGLPVVGVRERDLYERAANQFRVSTSEIGGRIDELRRSLGPPWTQDQKFAALAGWLALSDHPSAR
jgi:hypothetical protein